VTPLAIAGVTNEKVPPPEECRQAFKSRKDEKNDSS
jgi:hypothetical protein